MELINTDGMALIGPGSEWFWSMLQLVIVAVSLFGLYRQLKLQSSASAFEQLRAIIHEWGSEQLLRCRIELLKALQGGTELVKLPLGIGVVMLDYLVWDQLANVCETWWTTMKPSIVATREEEGDSAIGSSFEWLATLMGDLDRKNGIAAIYDEAYVVSTIDERLARTADTLRLVTSLRAPVKREAA